ncbi:hypothetical protein MHYP_G00087190 [Metynnis hypsauchen]
MKSADSTTAAGSGKIKLTAKANDERLQHVVSARESKLGQLTRRMNQMVQLIDEGDDSNLQIVQTMLAVQFNKLFGEFCELNTTVKALLQQISEDEMNEDQDKWFEPRANTFMDFLERAKAWMKEVHLRMAESEKHNEEVEPSDSVSAASVTSRKQGSISSSSAHSKASSSASAARLKAELERVALLAKASALKQKQELDTQEAKAKQEAETILARLKLQREELEIPTALAASDAKFKVLDEFECLQVASRTPSPDGMNSYIETAKPFESQACKQLKITPHSQAREASHPVFGSIMDGPKSQAKVYPRETSLRKSSLGRVCTTATTAVTNLVEEKPAKMSLVCAFSKPCLFCQGEQHTMEHCKKMKRSLHKEKIDFLRSKVLHMKTKVVSTEVEHKGVPSDNGEDASETGYGTVSYLLQNNKSNRVHCTLVMAKARVAPLKPITVPRMELAAATMAARMDKTLRSELQLQLKESVFWSDSTTVLKYIRNRTSRYRTFVANRVETILKLSEVRQWRYVNTSKNPADHVSRGLKVHAFMQNETWIQGPDFLTKPEDEWPQNPDHPENLTTEDPEVRDVIVSATATEEQVDTVQQLLEHYSSWFRLRKAVAWILKRRAAANRSSDEAEMIIKFNVAYNITKEELPFAKFKSEMTLQKIKGLNVNPTYSYDVACARLIGVLTDTLKKRRLRKSRTS